MFKKILALLTLATIVSCSANPVSVEKLSSFNLSNYNTFYVKVAGNEDAKVSPFTKSGLKKEFTKQLKVLGLTVDEKTPDFFVKISLDIGNGKRSSMNTWRRNRTPYYGGGFQVYVFDDDYNKERSYLRATLYSTADEEPLWTGLRATKYVDTDLKLSEEEIIKYVESFLDEIVNSQGTSQ